MHSSSRWDVKKMQSQKNINWITFTKKEEPTHVGYRIYLMSRVRERVLILHDLSIMEGLTLLPI